MAQGPLSHLTVIDLTQFLSGPYGTQILGDLGARVIKIESPEGDITHTLAPHFVKGESAYYLSVNRNKEDVVVDLKHPRGQELLLALVDKADIVMENFRPGVAKRLGCDWETLHARNPKMVMCSITGFGQDGAYRERPAYDIIVQALSGGMSITGEEGGKPVRTGIPLGDIAAGMYGVIGVLASALETQRTGVGRHIDVAMLDCQVAMLSYQAAYHLVSGEVPGPQGRGHLSIPTYRAYQTNDGLEVVVAANSEKMWRGLCTALTVEYLTAEKRFLLNKDRLANRADLDALLEPRFANLTQRQALEALMENNVPCAPINQLDSALRDPQVVYRQMVIRLQDDAGDSVEVVGNPIKVSGFDSSRHSYPPALGHHTYAVLRDLLGLGEQEINELAHDGVFGSVEAPKPENLTA